MEEENKPTTGNPSSDYKRIGGFIDEYVLDSGSPDRVITVKLEKDKMVYGQLGEFDPENGMLRLQECVKNTFFEPTGEMVKIDMSKERILSIHVNCANLHLNLDEIPVVEPRTH